MVITRVETVKGWVGWRNLQFVKVYTDEGLYGIGEGTMAGKAETVEGAIHEFSRYLIGREPLGRERLWEGMYNGAARWRGGCAIQTAIAALDMALCDIEGKRLGVPVWRLLGGPYWDSVRVYWTHWGAKWGARTPQELAAHIPEALEAGWTAVKFGGGGRRGEMTEQEAIRDIAARVEAVRKAGGPDLDIAIDVGERFTARSALELAWALAPYRLMFLEEPVPYENAQVMAKVGRESPVPIATGENLLTRWEFREIIESQAVGIIQPDVAHTSITEMKKIADYAHTYFIQLAPHCCSGPVMQAASVHVALSCPNTLILEWEENQREDFARIADTPLQAVNGHILLPERPGLGVDVDFEAFRRNYPYRPMPGPGHIMFRQ